jgi:hypothetical protein
MWFLMRRNPFFGRHFEAIAAFALSTFGSVPLCRLFGTDAGSYHEQVYAWAFVAHP